MNNTQGDAIQEIASGRDEEMMTQSGADDELPEPLCIARYFAGIRTLSVKKHSRCLSSELYHFFKEER